MVYTVDLGDGRVVDIEGPPDATAEQLQAVAAQSGGATVETVPEVGDGEFAFNDQLPPDVATKMGPEDEAQYQQLLRSADVSTIRRFLASKGFGSTEGVLEQFVQTRDAGQPVDYGMIYKLPKPTDPAGVTAGDQSANAMARGVLDTVLMGTPAKLGAAVAGGQAMLEGGDFGDAYSRMLDQNNGVIDRDEEQDPWFRVLGQLLGGLALPAGMEGIGLKAGTDVLRLGGTISEARVAAKIAVRNRMAAVGASYGAAHGAGSSDSLSEAAGGAVVEGALGAATGGLLGQAGRAQKPVAEAMSAGAEVMQAAKRQNIDVLPADVGGPVTRRLTSAFAQTAAGAYSIVGAAQRVIEKGKAVRDQAASVIGQSAEPEAAGEAALAGAKTYIKSSAGRIGRIYDTAANMAGGVRLPLTNAKRVLDDQIARLREVPGGGNGLAEAERLRADLDGAFTVQGIRDMRTEMFVAPDFRGTPVERRMRDVVTAAAEDIEGGLIAAGKGDAARAFATADRQWRERLSTIERVLEPIVGKSADKSKSGEEIVAALQRAAKGNGIRLEKFVAALPDEEARVVRASLIGRLGRSSDGAQNTDGDAFSLNQFLTDWNRIGERSKAAIFGLESRAALNDLAKVAEGLKQASRYANTSNTGGAVGNLATGATLALDLQTLGATIALQFGAGKVLASPAVARWIARAPKARDPGAHLTKLSAIARSEPAIANEVLALQARLQTALSGGQPARLAAEEGGNGSAVADGNERQNRRPGEGAAP